SGDRNAPLPRGDPAADGGGGALRKGPDPDGRPGDRAGGCDRGTGGGGVAHHHRARSDEPVVRRPGGTRGRAGRPWLHAVRGPGRPGGRGDGRPAGPVFVPLEPSPWGGAGGRSLDAGGVTAAAGGRRRAPAWVDKRRQRAGRGARRGEAALRERAPGGLGRVPGPPRRGDRGTPAGMTAPADDELWSAIGDPSRRR